MITELNSAKEMLRVNRKSLSTDVKQRMIEHIKEKTAIIEQTEKELSKKYYQWHVEPTNVTLDKSFNQY